MAGICTNGLDTGFASLSYLQVAVLGIVQGITELLPISSTAHMRVIPALLGWQDPGSAFSAAMQLAALIGVVTYYWRDIRMLTTGALQATLKGEWEDWSFRFLLWIGLATLPIVIAGIGLSNLLNTCGSPLRSLWVIGLASLGMAILLAFAEWSAKHIRTLAHVTLQDTLIVGFAQVGALIPGVSRSGSTLTAALWLGLERAEAARFSFFLGLPAITLAGLKELYALWQMGLDLHAWSILGVGLLTGSLSAFLAIWTLLHILERFSSWPFVAYRAVFGLFLLVSAAWGWFN